MATAGMTFKQWIAGIALLCTSAAGAAQLAFDCHEWPKTDFSRRTIKLDEIDSGGPPKDGIPAIDRPGFVTTAAASKWLRPKEPVIVLRLAGEARAYPIQILMFHEIVNDTVGDAPVAVTFCPLCNASFVFERRVGNRVLDFGTTGKLRKSDLVMYDRQTESWWQQFNGSAIVGHYAGTTLRTLPSEITAFEDFAAAFPGGKVLTRATGYFRPYGRNPYRGYDRIDQTPFLFTDPLDKRLPPMERVISISAGGRHRIYPFSVLEKTPVANGDLGGTPYVIFVKRGMLSPLDQENIVISRAIPAATAFNRRLGNRVLEFKQEGGDIIDTATRSRWNLFGEAVAGTFKGSQLKPVESGVHFAFAWLAFNPNSEIVRAP